MRRAQDFVRLVVVACAAAGFIMAPGAAPSLAPDAVVTSFTVLATGGGNVDWSPAANQIAFDQHRQGEHYALYVMNPDGSAARCLSCDVPGLPQRNVGQPLWSPDGTWLVFQAQKANHPFTMFSIVTHPTGGIYNDLWAMEAQSRRVRPLRQTPSGRDSGALRPCLPRDGAMLAWSEMHERPSQRGAGQEVGYWHVMVADVSWTADGPRLDNLRSLRSPGNGFHEVYDFTPDGRGLLLAANFERRSKSVFRSMDLYLQNLSTQQLTRLTTEGCNLHARFTPEGRHIVFAHAPGAVQDGADYWVMRPDGSEKRRISFFNVKGHPSNTGKAFVVADFAWAPDGQSLVAYCHDGWKGLRKANERILRLWLGAPNAP